MSIELFNVLYRPGIGEAPIALLCQALDIAGEKYLWVDGVNADDPVLVSVSACSGIEWAGSFEEFMAARSDLTGQILAESQGLHSPTLLARSLLYMSRDEKLSAVEALEMSEGQGLDVLDGDDACANTFGVALRRFEMSTAA